MTISKERTFRVFEFLDWVRSKQMEHGDSFLSKEVRIIFTTPIDATQDIEYDAHVECGVHTKSTG